MADDKPWRDRDLMYELYVERGMSAREINEHLGEPVHKRTISEWLNRLDIPTRDRSEAGVLAKLKTRIPCFYTDDSGYERWETRYRNQKYVVKVHRLLAVAEYGFEAVAGDNHVHHKNGIRWDNRPENIKVLFSSDHMAHHAEERDDWGNEVGLIAQHGAEAVLGPNEQYGSKAAAREAKFLKVADIGGSDGGSE